MSNKVLLAIKEHIDKSITDVDLYYQFTLPNSLNISMSYYVDGGNKPSDYSDSSIAYLLATIMVIESEAIVVSSLRHVYSISDPDLISNIVNIIRERSKDNAIDWVAMDFKITEVPNQWFKT